MQTNDPTSSSDTGAPSLIHRVVFWGLLALIFIAPLKFGNPIATQATQYPPREFSEWTVGFAMDFVFIPAESHSWLNQWFVCAVLVFFALVCCEIPLLNVRSRSALRQLKPMIPLLASLLIFIAAQTVSVCGTTNFESSHDTTFVFMSYVGLAIIVSEYAKSTRQTSLIIRAMALSVFAVCWFAFTQRFVTMQAAPPWEEIYRVVGTGPEAVRVMQKYVDRRIFSTLVYPNTLGGFLALASPMVFAAMWHWRDKFTRGALIALAVALGAMLAAVLGWTRSNGGFLAVGVSMGATLLLWRTAWTKKLLIAGCAVALLAGFFAVAYGPKRISGGAATFSARLNYWRAAVDLAVQRPLKGWGAGAFGDLYPRYIKAEEFEGGRIPEEPRMAHNGFLQIAADSGLLAAMGYSGVWILAMIGAARLYWRRSAENSGEAGMWLAVFAGLVAWTTHELVDFDLYVPGVAAFAFVLAGLVLGAQSQEGIEANQGTASDFQVSTVDPKINKTLTWAARIGWSVGVGMVVVWLLRISSANYYYIEAKELMFEQQPSLALPSAIEARWRAPYSATYASYEGEVYLSMGEWGRAGATFEEATLFAPHRAGNYFRAAMSRRQHLKQVDEKVVKNLRRAVELYPANPTYRAALAEAEKAFTERPSK